ncbi:MAG: RagB/SusD family nutrient uptake outer membrane protein [Bacteroidales bacterium]|nr:RagB/SusD family nutrient uptake outer membrane protein [Bacteroidales bacterium]
MVSVKNTILIAAVICTASLTTACLNEDTSSIVSPGDYFQSVEQCQTAVNGAYIPLKSIYNFRYMIAVEGTTDLASSNGSAQVDARLLISPANSGIGESVWPQCYIGIRNANCAIYGMEHSQLAREEVFAPLCEAKILRAYYYYLLTSFFGDVPFYRDYVNSVEDLERVTSLPRMSAVQTRKSLVEELSEFAPRMKQIPTSAEPGNRCGAAMAWMLIAKMQMWNKDWQGAVSALENLRSIYGDLSRYSLDDIPFRYKNTAESIFEIQHAYEKGGINYASNCASVCMPHPRAGDSCTYDGVDIPELGNESVAWSPLRPTAYFSNSVMPEAAGDLRRDYNMVSSWNGHRFSRTWMGPKFWCPMMYASNDSNNYKVFRYADAILMMAECNCELGEYDKAVACLDEVRSRAGLPPCGTFSNKDKLMDEIRRERARELFGEFQRKFDLVRWGVWYKLTNQYNTYTDVQENIRPCHEYYPIPDQQVVASGYKLDNDAYKQYGL